MSAEIIGAAAVSVLAALARFFARWRRPGLLAALLLPGFFPSPALAPPGRPWARTSRAGRPGTRRVSAVLRAAGAPARIRSHAVPGWLLCRPPGLFPCCGLARRPRSAAEAAVKRPRVPLASGGSPVAPSLRGTLIFICT